MFEAIKISPMPYCYLCNKKIETGKGVRKEVYTGHSKTGGITSRSFWFGGRKYYRMRLVCNECAKPSPFSGVLTVLAVVLILFILWQFRGYFI